MTDDDRLIIIGMLCVTVTVVAGLLANAAMVDYIPLSPPPAE